MLSTDELLIEDWQGLESEFERLFIVYGYPVDDSCDVSQQEEAEAGALVESIVPGN